MEFSVRSLWSHLRGTRKRNTRAGRVFRTRQAFFQSLESRSLLAVAALDLSFSSDGLVQTDFGGSHDVAFDAALQLDGKLVVVGSAGPDMAIARYHPNGSLDTSFSSDGKVVVSVGPGEDIGHAVLIQPDGKIIVAGTTSSAGNANHDFAIIRLHPNGSLDTSFAGDGMVRYTATGWQYHDYGFAAALQPDGKILVGGQHQLGNNTLVNLAVLRFNSDGTIDTSFAGDGSAVANPQSVYAMALTPTGKIVGAGYESNSYAVVRFHGSGSLDTTLGGGVGYVTREFVTAGSKSRAEGLYLQPDGKMVLAGSYFEGGIQKVGLTRLQSNGNVDTSFGSGGVVTTSLSAVDVVHDLEVQPDGNLVVVGSTKVGNYQKFLVLRYLPNGSLDFDYSLDGYGTVSFGKYDDESQAAVLQPDGKIILVGSSFDGGDDNFAVARLLPQTPNQPPVAVAGGPYHFSEGIAGTLDGSKSTDERIASAIYEWDFEYDGVNFRADAVGVQPEVIFPDNGPARTIALRVTDSDGLSSLSTATVSVANVAPQLYASGWATVDFGVPFVLHLESRDPGADQIISWRIDWGDGTVETVSGGLSEVTHPYPSASRNYYISVRGTDEDGTYSANSVSVAVRNLTPANGAVDSGFGGGTGWVATSFSADAIAHDALQQPDGKLIVVGTAGYRMALARYYPDGSLDRSFGGAGTGYVQTNVSNNQRYGDVAHGVALTDDGRIVVTGMSDYPNVTNRDVLVARYTADGVLDTTFAGTGVVVTKLTTRGDYALSVAIQADQKIVVGGTVDNGGNVEFAILRYQVDGTLDPTFSADGKLYVELGGTDDEANSILIQPDGRIVAAGNSAGDISLARIRPDGTLDTTFSSDGLVKIAVGSGTLDWGRHLIRQSDGKLIVAGHSDSGLKGRIALARLHSNGTLDTSFGKSGIVTTSVTYADDFGYDLRMDSQGRLVVAGYMNNGTTSEVILARYFANGALDPGFYGDGTFSASLSQVSDEGRSLVLGPADEIYIAGTTSDGASNRFLLARFAPTSHDPSLPPVADAGRPYIVAATATSVTLKGTGTRDEDDPESALLYEWDLDDDGKSFQVNATGVSPAVTIDPATLPRTIALRVTDPNGNTSLASTLLARSTDIPSLSVSGASSVQEGALYELSLHATGPGTKNITSWQVDWGDGNVVSYPASSTTVTHRYLDGPADHTIRAAAYILTTRYNAPPALAVQVLDVLPELNVSTTEVPVEGRSFTLDMHYRDHGADPAIEWTIDWGDGGVTSWPGAAERATHIYADGPAQHTIRATVTNGDGAFSAAPLVVDVRNDAPTLRVLGPAAVDEGVLYTVQFTSFDPGRDTIKDWTIHWGDGTSQTLPGNSSSVGHIYTSAGAKTVTATATDEDGTFAAPPLQVFVGDIPPEAIISGEPTVREGNSYRLNLAATSPGPDRIESWFIDWGDGTSSRIDGNPREAFHIYADGWNEYTIRARVADDDGVYHVPTSVSVVVENEAPRLTISGPLTTDEGAEYRLRLASMDPGQDTIARWIIDWGDGQIDEVAGNESWVTHIFADGPAEHEILARATDEDGTFASNVLKVSVQDRQPEFCIEGALQTAEGSEYALSLCSRDWGADAVSNWRVNWGDGTEEMIFGASAIAWHTYADGLNHHTIQVTAHDDDGPHSAPSLDVEVLNVAPSVALGGPASIDEGSFYPLQLAWSDVGDDQLSAWWIDWGDGTSELFSGDLHQAQHAYGDGPADYLIQAIATDEDGSYLTNSISVHVRDVDPQLHPSGPEEVFEAAPYRLELRATDVGDDRILEWYIDWGDGTDQTVLGGTQAATHRYLDGLMEHLISVRAWNEDGVYAAMPFSVRVLDVAPELSIGGAPTTDEGATYTLHLAAFDPGMDTLQQWQIDWGDGTTTTVGGGASLATHVYRDGDATFEIRATASNEDGTFQSNVHHVSILNQAPRLRIDGEPETYESGTYRLNLFANDTGDDVIQQWWIDWGDGSTELVKGNPSFVTHTYTDGPESFVLRATARDEDGEYPAENHLVLYVHNIAPQLQLEAPLEAEEGASYTIYFSASDPGFDTIDHWTIDWGDGFTEILPGASTSATHVFRDGDGRVALRISATDEDGTWSLAQREILVRDVPPELVLTGPDVVDEGSPIVLHLAVVDPGDDPVLAWIIDWGDGTVAELDGHAREATHTYSDGPHGYAARVSVRNDDGEFAAEPWPIAVLNVPPALELLGPPVIDEGDVFELRLSSSEPGADTIIEWTIDWGDGHIESYEGNPSRVTHIYDDGNNAYGIRATARDEDGLWPVETVAHVRVQDRPPVLTVSGAPELPEGSEYTLFLHAFDPGDDTITAWTIRWGDGTADVIVGNPSRVTHTYLNGNAQVAIEAVATDEDGDHAVEIPWNVQIWNMAPRFDSIEAPPSEVEVDQEWNLRGIFSDVGILDSHRVTIDWGDGSPLEWASVSEVMGSGSFAARHSFAEEGHYTVTLVVDDGDGGSDTHVLRVEAIAVVPILTQLTSNDVDEGGMVTLRGSYAGVRPTKPYTLTVDWGDGSIESTVVSGGSFELQHPYLDDAPTGTPADRHPIQIVLSDGRRGTVAATTFTTVTNLHPVITDLVTNASFCGDAVASGNVSLAARFEDLGILDTHSAVVDWGDGYRSSATIEQGFGTGRLHADHRYATGGVYTVTITIVDDDGGEIRRTASVAVTGAGVIGSTLYVVATDRADHITVNQAGNKFKVHANFLPSKSFYEVPVAGISRIVVRACEDNDHVTIAGSIYLPTSLDGGSGDDHLNGGNGPNILIGGPGNDHLIGGSQRDLMIGGLGVDRLVGNGDDDILIGGTTVYDEHDQALAAILAEWQSSRSVQQRRFNLSRGTAGADGSRYATRMNGDFFLVDQAEIYQTVFDDSAADQLTGSSGVDWYFAER